MAKGCALSTGYLPWGGLQRNSVDRLTDRPDMTSAVDRGRKASTQANKHTKFQTAEHSSNGDKHFMHEIAIFRIHNRKSAENLKPN